MVSFSPSAFLRSKTLFTSFVVFLRKTLRFLFNISASSFSRLMIYAASYGGPSVIDHNLSQLRWLETYILLHEPRNLFKENSNVRLVSSFLRFSTRLSSTHFTVTLPYCTFMNSIYITQLINMSNQGTYICLYRYKGLT